MTDSGNTWGSHDGDEWFMRNDANTAGVLDTTLVDPVSPHSADAAATCVRLDYLREALHSLEKIEGDDAELWVIAEEEKPLVMIPRTDRELAYAVAPRVSTERAYVDTPLDSVRESDAGDAETDAETVNVELSWYECQACEYRAIASWAVACPECGGHMRPPKSAGSIDVPADELPGAGEGEHA